MIVMTLIICEAILLFPYAGECTVHPVPMDNLQHCEREAAKYNAIDDEEGGHMPRWHSKTLDVEDKFLAVPASCQEVNAPRGAKPFLDPRKKS